MKKLLMSCMMSAALLLAVLCPLAGSAVGNTQNPLWEDWGFDSLEEFLEDMDMTEEEYYEFEKDIRDWEAWDADYEARRQAERDAELEDMGGMPGETNVMYNGEFVQFEGAVPELVDGSVFSPAKPFLEALGADVYYQAGTGTITAVFPDMKMSLALGDDTLSIVKGGVSQEISLSAAPYARDGVSYVPVRAIAEGMGIRVFWDSAYRTAVAIDANAIEAGIDKDLTILNSLLKMPVSAFPDSGGAYETVLRLLVSMTIFNSLDGDAKGKFGADLTILTEGPNFSMTGEIDLTDLMQIIMAAESGYVYDDEYAEELNERFGMLSQRIKVDIIYNSDKETVYVKAPILSEVLAEFPKDAWLAISGSDRSFGGLGLDDIMGSLDIESITGDASIGSLIGAGSVGEFVVSDSLDGWRNYIHAYTDLIESAELARTLLGDDRFMISDGSYTLKLNLDDLRAAAPESFGYGYYSYYSYRYASEFDLKLIVKTSGSEIVGLSGGFVYRDGFYYVTRYSATFDISADRIKLDFEFHEKNERVVLVELDMAIKESSKAVPEGPPAGATIVDLEDLYEAMWGYDEDDDPVIQL